jgi:adenylosuccinate lyase
VLLQELSAISPVDGRYRNKTAALAPFFSEFGLIRYRVLIEVEYLLALADAGIPGFDSASLKQKTTQLRSIYMGFELSHAEQIKTTEKTTNHDVKAVEYFVKDQLDALGLSELREWVHFGLTSQDINNTAIPLSLKEACTQILIPELEQVCEKLKAMSKAWIQVPMLAHTHGQPASPSRLGKEIYVFVSRLEAQLKQLHDIEYSAKFGGATGNFNAHHAAYPGINWEFFANSFVNQQLGLSRSAVTTQIEHYDNLAALFDAFRRINTILIDLCRDIWSYVSMNYFRQKIKAGEVGSSAMPHKVNPIDFENAEGNLGMANAILGHLSEKLPVSRLQRDLTDSTVLRNVGVPLAHSLIAWNSILKGLDKLLLNEDAIRQDLDDNWAVVAEAIQTILRREAYPNPYEKLKELTRTNERINEQTIAAFISDLDVSDELKAELRAITPFNYTGIRFSFENQ